jgi:hypothetical protein
MKRLPIGLAALIAIGIAGLCTYRVPRAEPGANQAVMPQANQSATRDPGASEVYLTHVHGLSYSADGTKIFVPSHQGLAIYYEKRWYKAPGAQHDYMGFSATRDAFYSSGHPAPGSTFRNPFGLLKSTDTGETWRSLGLSGEADFHLMSASYHAGTVYVFNQRPNSQMSHVGLYYTTDDGKTWLQCRAHGLGGNPIALAVHPLDGRKVAIGAENGLYLSRDRGDSLELLVARRAVTSVMFDLDGETLWFGSVEGKPTLTRMAMRDSKSLSVGLPPMDHDAVAYIAQNPKDPAEIAIATFQRDVYVLKDRGKTWKQIAKEGKTS